MRQLKAAALTEKAFQIGNHLSPKINGRSNIVGERLRSQLIDTLKKQTGQHVHPAFPASTKKSKLKSIASVFTGNRTVSSIFCYLTLRLWLKDSPSDWKRPPEQIEYLP